MTHKDQSKIPKPKHIKLRINGSDIEYGLGVTKRDQFSGDPIIFYQTHPPKIVEAMLPAENKRILPGARVILPNGGLIYSNTGNHVEHATAECLGARELALHETAGLEILTEGVNRFNQSNPNLPKVSLHKTNCSCELDDNKRPLYYWGSHASFLTLRTVTIDLRENLMKEFLMSGWPLIGNGWFKVVDKKYLRFIFSQRAEIISASRGATSTCPTAGNNSRPMFHLRDEPHADNLVWQRIHDISLNANLSQYQIFLKYGIYDLVLAMVEAKDFLRPLPLIDHIALGCGTTTAAYTTASLIFNEDICFQRPVKLQNGRSWTSIDFQLHYFKEACRFFAQGRGTLTPERKIVLNFWGKILRALKRWDLPYLAQYLDWAAILYYEVLPRLRRLGFDPTLLFLPPSQSDHSESLALQGIPYDHQFIRKEKDENLLAYFLYFITSYANVDTSASPYGLYLRQNKIKSIFTRAEIEFAKNNPPARTRATLREEIIRHPPENTTLQTWCWDKLYFAISNLVPSICFDLPNPYRYGLKNGIEEFLYSPPPSSFTPT